MMRRMKTVDMSSGAIDRRLRTVSQLRKLGLSIAKAKRISGSDASQRAKLTSRLGLDAMS